MDFGNISIPFNYVLVEIAGAYITKVGSLIVESYQKERAANCYGVVRAVPEKLLYFKKEIDSIKNEFGGTNNCPLDRVEEIQELNKRSLAWDTDMEAKVGDSIVMKYTIFNSAYKEGRVFEFGKKLLILVPYDFILVALRGDEIIPLNGQLVLTPVTKKHEGAINLDYEPEVAQIGVIEFIGSPVRGYLGSDDSDDDFYQKGDTVLFKRNSNVLLEEKVFRQLDKPFVRLQRRHLLGRVQMS